MNSPQKVGKVGEKASRKFVNLSFIDSSLKKVRRVRKKFVILREVHKFEIKHVLYRNSL